MSPRQYIEAVALELTKLRGKGLVLSSADAALALAWHKDGVPLEAVLAEIRKGTRLKARAQGVRGAAEVGISLHAIAPAIFARTKVKPGASKSGSDAGLGSALLRACGPQLPARAAWVELARRADELLHEGGDAYWTAAVAALRSTLRELPRPSVRKVSAALRARMAPRPRGMPKQSYKRSLQLMLLAAASEELGVPPKAFLL
jgi:hypothetical protein